MKHVIHLDNKPVVLIYPDTDEEILVEDITKIDYGNLYGEAVTLPVMLNTVGRLKAQCESFYQTSKLECDIYEANLRKNWRREANGNAGKFTLLEGKLELPIKLTEKSLEEAVLLDKGFQVKKNNVIKAKRDWEYLDSLHWAVSSKDRKLNNLIKGVTPEELYSELVDGKINGILIKKAKKDS